MKRLVFAVVLVALTTAASCNKSTPTSPSPPTGGTPPTTTSVPPTTTIPPAPAATFTVAGLLRDASTQAPIGGGNVRVQAGTGLNASSGTDGNGYYSIPGVNGAIVLAFSGPNYDPRSQTVQVNGDTRFDFVLTRSAPPWSHTGVGDNVFTMPNVGRVRIVGTYNSFCENFIVRIAGRLVVNVILGTCSSATTGRRHEGVYLTTGGVVEITGSAGVIWEFSQA